MHPLLNPRHVDAAADINELNPTEELELMRLDAEEDQAIRNIAAGEVYVLYFDWNADFNHFEGVREEFTGLSGPTFAVEGQEVGDEPENATSQIVFNLMRPLFGRGHTLVMDNFYNSPLLSRLLKLKHQTDTMGTLRLNREFVPEGLKAKTKKNMKAGEVAFSSTKDICVVVYMDKIWSR